MKKFVILLALLSFGTVYNYAEEVTGSVVEGNPNIYSGTDQRDLSQDQVNTPDVDLGDRESENADEKYGLQAYKEIMLQPAYIPGSDGRLQLMYVENNTVNSEFKLYYGAGLSRGLVFPQSKYVITNQIILVQSTPVQLLCSRGSYLSIYVQDDGHASGEVEDGYEGPYYLSMWLKYPQVSEQDKVTVRYIVKEGKYGQVGLKIGSHGECQVVAVEDIKFI